MAWLRIDDGFASHPKITALSDRELRVWLRTLCYCARYQTQGYLTPEQRDEIPGLTAALTSKLERVGLLDDHGPPDDPEPLNQAVLYVHDYHHYDRKDDTAAERARRYRRNKRRDALRDEAVTPDRDEAVTRPRARSLARAGGPSPTPCKPPTAPEPAPSPNQEPAPELNGAGAGAGEVFDYSNVLKDM